MLGWEAVHRSNEKSRRGFQGLRCRRARVSFSVLDGGAGVHRDIEIIATESSKTKPTMTTGDGVGG